MSKGLSAKIRSELRLTSRVYTMDSDVRVLDVSTDTISSEPTETASEMEMIELDASYDAGASTSCLIDENPTCRTRSAGQAFSPDSSDIEIIHPRSDSQFAQPMNVAPRPVFKVMFRDESVSRRYRQEVKDFLHALVQSKPCLKKNSNESSLTLEIWDDEVDSKDDENALDDSVQYLGSHDFLFTIDKQRNVKNDFDIPIYGQKYDTFEESKHEASKDFVPKLNCFNCNGNHNLRDCPKPKNQNNINKNRKEFAMKYSAGVRYHMSEDQRFSHMVPGQMSPKLQKALGLKDNQLPKHIYRMRLLGYPPGWLEEARLQHSGLSLFNSDGVAESDINKEEGEIIMDVDKDRYDIKKIYDFPGFNVPPSPGTIEESHKYRVPQMQLGHSKQMMLLHLQGKEADDGYKRKKLILPPPVNNVEIVNNVTISDMEIEDTLEENAMENVSVNGHFVPPLPKESVQQPLPPPPPAELPQTPTDDLNSQSRELMSSDSADDTTSTSNSPSLIELERTKEALLMEIEETNSQSNSDSMSAKNDSSTVSASETPFSSITATPSTSRASPNEDSAKSDLQGCPDTPVDFNTTIALDTSVSDRLPQSNSTPIRSTLNNSLNTSQASVKSVHLGTPILPSTSPYSKLPTSEKFSKDICDVINFENLPDSTGKYEQMSGVLQKVRSTMARLHQ